MAKGWIKLHRSIMDHWVYESFEMQHYWIDLLLVANHEDKKIPFYKTIITIKAGQKLTSYRKLADRWHINKNTVKTVLNTFSKDGMIIVENKYNGTLITIVNYKVYQGIKGGNRDTDSDTLSDTDSDTMADTDSDTDYTQTRIYKNDIRMNKNEKEKAAPLRDLGGYIIED